MKKFAFAFMLVFVPPAYAERGGNSCYFLHGMVQDQKYGGEITDADLLDEKLNDCGQDIFETCQYVRNEILRLDSKIAERLKCTGASETAEDKAREAARKHRDEEVVRELEAMTPQMHCEALAHDNIKDLYEHLVRCSEDKTMCVSTKAAMEQNKSRKAFLLECK